MERKGKWKTLTEERNKEKEMERREKISNGREEYRKGNGKEREE